MNEAAARQRTILVVDDDVDIRKTVASVLEEDDYHVVTAGNGREALTYLTGAGASRPDLILLDMMMPIMDGVAFREQQQRHPELASIPILIFTAFSAPADTSWAAGHLSKPLRLDALLATIARHLA